MFMFPFWNYDAIQFLDRGMCCSFNMAAADDIYISNTFTRNLMRMQDQALNPLELLHTHINYHVLHMLSKHTVNCSYST